MYNNAIVASEIISILICIIILYGTIFETKIADSRKWNLASVIGLHIFFIVADVLAILPNDKVPSSVIIILASISCVGGFFVFALFMNYLYLMEADKDIRIRGWIRPMIATSIVSAVITTALIISGVLFSYKDGVYYLGWGYYIYMLLYMILFSVAIIFLIRFAKVIGKHDSWAFFSYFLSPLVCALITSINPDFGFGYVAVTISFLIVYVMLQSKLHELNEQKNYVYFQSIASVYHSMHLINLKENTFSEFGAATVIGNYLGTHRNLNIQEIMWGIMSQRICEAHRDAIMKFTDFSTLAQRMAHRNSIDIELINVDNKWFRFSFIRIGEESDGLSKVFFASQNIDESKRKENDLILMSNTDELTKIYNRRAYETNMQEIARNGIGNDLWYMSFDLNGLKEANDTKGHSAGDELIIAIADCISKAVASYGRTYRVGGDEFVSILRGSDEEINQVLLDMEILRRKWRGKYTDELSFSKGVVCSSEFPNCIIADLEREVDKRMYEEKNVYHMINGTHR